MVGKSFRVRDPRKDENQFEENEKKEITTSLVELRKKFNIAKDTENIKDSEIQRLRKQMDNNKEEAGNMEKKAAELKEKYESLKQSFKQQTYKYDLAELDKESYEHMLETIKHDKIVYQIKLFNMQAMIGAKDKELANVIDESKKAEQLQIQSRIFLDGLMQSIEVEKKKREESLVIFKNTIQNRQDQENDREERIKKTNQIAANAVNEIGLNQEKKWRKLVMVHKFVSGFLKTKMEREMARYRTLEQAYQKIKATTGVYDAREIVTRFTSREKTYSELLISIAEYERKLDALKKEKEALSARLLGLKTALQQPQRGKTGIWGSSVFQNLDLQELEKELDLRTSQYKSYRLTNDKLHTWSINMLKRFDKVTKRVRSNPYENYNRDQTATAFLKVIENFKNIIETIDAEEAENVIDEIERANINEEIHSKDYVLKNTRVKPGLVGEIPGVKFELERIDSLPEENDSKIESQSAVSDVVVNTKPKALDAGQELQAEEDYIKSLRSSLKGKLGNKKILLSHPE